MTIRFDLSPDVEARLTAKARAQGLPLERVAEQLLRDALTDHIPNAEKMSVDDFHRMLGAIARGSETVQDLPTGSFSRASFYEDPLDGGNTIPRR